MLARLGDIQLELRAQRLEGWLLTDSGGQNRIPALLLGLGDPPPTRRYFYWIPANGMPVLMCSRSDASRFGDVQGEVWQYSGWSDYRDQLGRLFDNEAPIAMEHCPMGSNPFLDRVSGGVLELIRSYGAFIVSSADVIPALLGGLDEAGATMFDQTGPDMEACVREIFAWLADRAEAPSERATATHLSTLLAERKLVEAFPPRVAFGHRTAQIEPVPTDAVLQPDDIVRVEVAARRAEVGACCVEVCRAGWVETPGGASDAKRGVDRLLSVLGETQARVVELISTRLAAGRRVLGFELDRVARDVLHRYRDLREGFPHRLGHALGPVTPFGEAGLLDDLEIHDTRPLTPGSAWCIKPGLYLEETGARSCASVRITPHGVSFAASPQLEVDVISRNISRS